MYDNRRSRGIGRTRKKTTTIYTVNKSVFFLLSSWQTKKNDFGSGKNEGEVKIVCVVRLRQVKWLVLLYETRNGRTTVVGCWWEGEEGRVGEQKRVDDG